MHIADCPHLIGIVEAIGNKKNIHVAEVHNEPTVSPLDHSDAPELIGQYIPFANFFTVFVFQTRVLADCIGVNFVNDCLYSILLRIFCHRNNASFPIKTLHKTTDSPFHCIRAFASEFNFSHSLQFFL